MAQLQDIALKERLFLKSYPFFRYAPHVGNLPSLTITPLQKPLSEARIALITTAGLSMPGQPPFDVTIKMGDPSFRVIPGTCDPQLLEQHHRSGAFDHSGVEQDRNLVLPLDRLREMLQRAEIGSIAHEHYSFMGSIIGPNKLINESAPTVAQRLVADHVDVVFLTPV